MAEQFKVVDLIESLVRLEQFGKRFYVKCAEKTEEVENKKFFNFLADQESRHEEIYKDLASKYEGQQGIDNKYDEDYSAYLSALVNQSFDFDEDIDVNDFKVAMKRALGLEKDTIIFISEVENILNSKDEVIEKIKEEERGHIRLINDYWNAHKDRA
ncbi:MAG: ferritin family protein [Peptoniphilus sp.]|nr:ferritin family protein [Peptoniphilus sp.]MDY3118417.1 ferritin family protein [Peptoniphilus sp.]